MESPKPPKYRKLVALLIWLLTMIAITVALWSAWFINGMFLILAIVNAVGGGVLMASSWNVGTERGISHKLLGCFSCILLMVGTYPLFLFGLGKLLDGMDWLKKNL